MFWSAGRKAKLFQFGHAANPGCPVDTYPAIKDRLADWTELNLVSKNNPKQFAVWRQVVAQKQLQGRLCVDHWLPLGVLGDGYLHALELL